LRGVCGMIGFPCSFRSGNSFLIQEMFPLRAGRGPGRFLSNGSVGIPSFGLGSRGPAVSPPPDQSLLMTSRYFFFFHNGRITLSDLLDGIPLSVIFLQHPFVVLALRF